MRPQELLQNVDLQKIADEGEKIYATMKTKYDPLEKGKFLAINIGSRQEYLGDTSAEAVNLALRDHPDQVFYVVKIGFDTVETIARTFFASR